MKQVSEYVDFLAVVVLIAVLGLSQGVVLPHAVKVRAERMHPAVHTVPFYR